MVRIDEVSNPEEEKAKGGKKAKKCGACTGVSRKCKPNCPYKTFFPSGSELQAAFICKSFHKDNLFRIMNMCHNEEERAKCRKTLFWIFTMLERDPVNTPVDDMVGFQNKGVALVHKVVSEHLLEKESVLLHAQEQISPKGQQPPLPIASKVLCLRDVVNEDLLQDDILYREILADMKSQCTKYGDVVNVVIPRPGEAFGGNVFIEYIDIENASRALTGLNGKVYHNKKVVAEFYDEEKFQLLKD